MSFVAQIARSLFPNDPPRPARRRTPAPSRLQHLLAITCALVPLGAMLHAWSETA